MYSIRYYIKEILITIIIIAAVIIGIFFFLFKTESGKRTIVDFKSSISGIERTVNVYTANGELMAQYNGKIDLEHTSGGGYVKFDFEGKRYLYYNCFVEIIGDIK